MYRSFALTAGGLLVGLALMAQPVTAQDTILLDLYGDGVHAYFDGQAQRAHEYLTSAIEGGTTDPRAFYFRGLSNLRLGNQSEAQADFRQGAQLETKDIDRVYAVSRSLERVQGSPRRMLENYRNRARLAAYTARQRQRYERYEHIREAEPNVLLHEEPVAHPPAEAPAPPPAKAAAPAAPVPAAAVPKGAPAVAAPAGAPKPDQPAPAAKGEDPFAAPPAEKPPAEKPPAEKPPAEKPAPDAAPAKAPADGAAPAPDAPAEKADAAPAPAAPAAPATPDAKPAEKEADPFGK